MYHSLFFSLLVVCLQPGRLGNSLASMYGREAVAARQLLGTCFLLRDTTPKKDPIKQPCGGTHLFKSQLVKSAR